MEKEKTIEILAALSFLVLIFIAVLIGLNFSKNSTSSTINYNYYGNIDNSEKNYYSGALDKDYRTYEKDYNRKLIRYSVKTVHTSSENYGIYTETYNVYVKNLGYSGRDFTVRFYFEDGNGDERTYEIKRYIYPDEEKRFYFRDITKDKYEYYRWRYEVLY